VDAVWRANQADGDGVADLDAGGVRLAVWRLGDDVVFRALTPAAFAAREAFGRGGRLATALERALALQPEVDLTGLIRSLLDDGVLQCRR
jgi:hypothetical protein